MMRGKPQPEAEEGGRAEGEAFESASEASVDSKAKEPEMCGRCRKEVKDEDAGLECETCNLWFHIGCENVTKMQYNCIEDSNKVKKGKAKSKVHWYCNTCEQVTVPWMKTMASLNTRQDNLEARMVKVEEDLNNKAGKDEVEELEGRVKKLEDSGESTAVNEGASTSKSSSEQTEEVIKELKDQEERKLNILFFNLPESKSGETSDTAKHDKDEVKHLAKQCKVTINKDEITMVKRLGKKQADKPRPLLIQVSSDEKKRMLFKNLRLLQDAPEKYKRVSVKNDLTEKQRSREKELRDEAKKKEAESSGEVAFKVRGPPWARKIVKVDAPKKK